MKTFSLFLLLFALTLLFSGCASDPEDKAFFESGWRHPGEIDTHINH